MLHNAFSSSQSNSPSSFSSRASALVLSTMMVTSAHASVEYFEGSHNTTIIGGPLVEGEAANAYVSLDPDEKYIAVMSEYPDHIDFANSNAFNWVEYNKLVTIDLSQGWQNGTGSGDASGDKFNAKNGYLGFKLLGGGEFTGSTNKEVVVMNGTGTIYESGGWDVAENADSFQFDGAFAEYAIAQTSSGHRVENLSTRTKVTLKNVANMQFSDGVYANNIFTADEPEPEPEPTIEIAARSFSYAPAPGVALTETHQCYIWRPDITNYPAVDNVSCISFENSGSNALIGQGDGLADINSQTYIFDRSFAVIGTPSGRDSIETARNGLVASGGGADIFYPKPGATVIGDRNWVTAIFSMQGSVVNLVNPSLGAGDAAGVSLNDINAIKMGSGNEAVHIGLGDVQKGLSFVNGGNGDGDNLYLEDFYVRVTQNAEGEYEAQGLTISNNRQITIVNDDQSASIRALDFEKIHVKSKVDDPLNGETIADVTLSYDKTLNTVSVANYHVPTPAMPATVYIAASACNGSTGEDCGPKSDEASISVPDINDVNFRVSWHEPTQLVGALPTAGGELSNCINKVLYPDADVYLYKLHSRIEMPEDEPRPNQYDNVLSLTLTDPRLLSSFTSEYDAECDVYRKKYEYEVTSEEPSLE